MAEYDEEELKMRASMFDASVWIMKMLNVMAVGEWNMLKMKYHFSGDEYPALESMVKRLSDKDAFKNLCGNPLIKMAMISNPKVDETKNEEG